MTAHLTQASLQAQGSSVGLLQRNIREEVSRHPDLPFSLPHPSSLFSLDLPCPGAEEAGEAEQRCPVHFTE